MSNSKVSSSLNSDPIPIKIVIVGDGSIGKTCILVSYIDNQFPKEYVPTVFDNKTSIIKVDGHIIQASYWDTAGQEQYNKLRPLAYPGTDVFLIAFAVNDPNSFINARKKWYPEVSEAQPNALFLFVGNKIDKRDQQMINEKDPKRQPILKNVAAKLFQDQMNCKYVECSALTREGLKNVFQQAVKLVLAKRFGKRQEQAVREPKSCYCQMI